MRRALPPVLLVLIAGLVVTAKDPPVVGWDLALSRTWPAAAARGAGALVQIRGAGGAARSGVVVAPGVVATCATNLDPLGPGPYLVEGQDGKAVPATVRGRDLRLRLVVLHAPGLAAAPLEPAPAPVPGTHCLVLGAVLDRRGTATSGIVSAVGRFEGRAFQLDAPLDGSNYGGAIVDLEGRLIGLPVHVDPRLGERSGVGFAISSARIAAVLEPLARGEDLGPGWIGLVVPRLGIAGAGVLVRGVAPGSPAEQAGIQAGERVVRLAGRPTPDRRAFREVLADLWAGQVVDVELADGKGGTRQVTLTATHKR